MSHPRIALGLAWFLLGSALVVGCTAEGIFDGNDESSPEEGSQLPNGGPKTSPGASDAGKDASKPSQPKDAGPPPPEPGTACKTIDQIFERPCGACGKQSAICIADESGNGKVTEYSVCEKELVGGCVPGTVVTESCGNCGKRTKTCSQFCGFSQVACTGEPANACPAGVTAWTTAGCVSGVTKRSCSDVCQWSSFTGVCGEPDYAVNIAQSLGATESLIFPLRQAAASKRVSGACGANATLSTTSNHPFAIVRVVNPSAKTAKVTAFNAKAPGGPLIDTVLTQYTRVPASDDDLKACVKIGESCPTATVPCGDTKFGALANTNQVVLGPNGTVYVVVTSAQPFDSVGQITQGEIMLSVRTDALD